MQRLEVSVARRQTVKETSDAFCGQTDRQTTVRGASTGAQVHIILFVICLLRPLDVTFTVTILRFFQLPTCLQKQQICIDTNTNTNTNTNINTNTNNVIRSDCSLSAYRNFPAFVCFSKADICAVCRRQQRCVHS